jgi:nitroreductase
MDFEKVIRQRKMMREYITNKQIPEELIMTLTKNAHRAPSAGHTQVQEFIIVKDSITKKIVKIFKGVTGLRMSRKFPDLESKLWRGVMWSPSYYVGTAGNISAETIERYIEQQQTEWKRGSSTG